ncbi:MAG: transcriptional regulator PpsR, partial [Pseudomonadota bacterium]
MGELDAASAARLAGTAGDVALVLDDQGAVLDVMAGGIELPERELRRWRGQAWADTVTAESRPKIEQLLADARDSGDPAPPRWRQV